MARKKNTPTTFDAWLGKTIDDEADPYGGRSAIAEWIGVSEQSVNRRSRGEVPYLAREVEIVAGRLGVPTAEIVSQALRRFGGIEKLLAEYGPKSEAPSNVTAEDETDYLGRVKPDYALAADENQHPDPKD